MEKLETEILWRWSMINVECTNCHHPIQVENANWSKTHRHSLSPGLVRALSKFAQAVYDKGENAVHLVRDMSDPAIKLGHSELANFQKLRYWGLVHKPNKDHRGKYVMQDGIWLLTRNGSRFLKGQLQVRKSIPTRENHIDRSKPEDQEMVSMGDFRGKVPEFQTIWKFEIDDAMVYRVSDHQQSIFDGLKKLEPMVSTGRY